MFLHLIIILCNLPIILISNIKILLINVNAGIIVYSTRITLYAIYKRKIQTIIYLHLIVVPQVAICSNLKFQFWAIQFEILNWDNLILLPQFKIGANFNVGLWYPKLSIARILNW